MQPGNLLKKMGQQGTFCDSVTFQTLGHRTTKGLSLPGHPVSGARQLVRLWLPQAGLLPRPGCCSSGELLVSIERDLLTFPDEK